MNSRGDIATIDIDTMKTLRISNYQAYLEARTKRKQWLERERKNDKKEQRKRIKLMEKIKERKKNKGDK